jgi:translation elongation factor EF-Tu-like GTPase
MTSPQGAVFKLTVEDVFLIRNRGVVATGRVESGTLRVGDTVSINGGPGVEVHAIEIFRKSIDEANAGDNVGVLFKGIDKSQLGRGAVLTSPGGAPPTEGTTVIM